MGRRIPLILSIDDDPDVCYSIEMRLRDYDIRVKQAYFGMQGFWEVIQEAPDLILLDMAMPQGNGEFVLECLKRNQHTAVIPVIVLTGTRDRDRRSQAYQLGAAEFLHKPIVFPELLDEIRRYVEVREITPTREHDEIPCVEEAAPIAREKSSRPVLRYDIGLRGSP